LLLAPEHTLVYAPTTLVDVAVVEQVAVPVRLPGPSPTTNPL
jgi:hypothetical protein